MKKLLIFSFLALFQLVLAKKEKSIKPIQALTTKNITVKTYGQNSKHKFDLYKLEGQIADKKYEATLSIKKVGKKFRFIGFLIVLW